MKKTSLVFLDFSGTLSMGAASFGFPRSLSRGLEESGLRALGIGTPEDFWKECINPFWKEGSTTSAGYMQLLQRALEERFSASPEKARLAAATFTALYLEASRIDGPWAPLLKGLASSSSCQGILVTDHYAEAKAHIQKELKRLGISRGLDVALSAEKGHEKREPEFWEKLRESYPAPYSRIYLVDDFGASESPGDAYAQRTKAEERRSITVRHIKKFFLVSPKVYFFCGNNGTSLCKTPEEHSLRISNITKDLKEVFA